MTEETFWSVIEQSKGSPIGASFQQEIKTLAKLLEELEADELLSFISIFKQQLRRAYSWELWAVAYIAFLGCSDGDFEEFRAWLLSNGKAPFERSLIDKDFAATLLKEHSPGEDFGTTSERFYLLPTGIYRKRFGSDPLDHLPEEVYSYKGVEPSGHQWEETEIAARFPSILSIFQRSPDEFA
jgi:Protein of unknown function (DUF4240)